MSYLKEVAFPRALGLSLVFLTPVLFLNSPALANGPIPPPEVRWVEGQLLVQVAEGVDLHRTREKAGSVTPAIDELNQRFGVVDAELVMPQYRPTAMETLRRSTKGRSMADAELELMDGLGRWVLLKADPTSDVEAMVEAYAKLDEVLAAEPNYIMDLVGAMPDASSPRQADQRTGPSPPSPKSRFIPNDPDFPSQWGLDYIDAPEAWDITMGDPSQVIAIIDTGVDLDHPDLVNKIWTNADEDPGDGNGDGCPGLCGIDDDGDGLIDEDRDGVQMGEPGWDSDYADDDDENSHIDDFLGWDWISNGEGYEDNDPQDDHGHGTHCAGIAAAETNNGIGIAGACPLCTVMPLKAFQASGTATNVDISKAVEYARRNGATVINMSFGSYAESLLVRDSLALAYSRAILVAAAGNDTISRFFKYCSPMTPAPFFPAHNPFVLGVEAGIPGGGLASFSNCQYETRTPGDAIISSVLDDSYASWSGTSMAAPFTSGIAALLRVHRATSPGWGPDLFLGQLDHKGSNALLTLTTEPEARIELDSWWIDDAVGSCPSCDGDGRPDSGEAFDIVLSVNSTWGFAEGVTGSVSSSHPFVTIVTPTADWGNIGPRGNKTNELAPFRISIDSAAGNNLEVPISFSVGPTNIGSGFARDEWLTVERGIEKTGILSADETWPGDYVYLIPESLFVPSGVRLTIEPGAVIQISEGKGIVIQGEIIARGTPENRIIFSANGSAGGYVSIAQGTPTVLGPSDEYVSGSIVEYAIFEHLKASPESQIVNPHVVLFRNNIIRYCTSDDAYIVLAVRGPNLFLGNLLYRNRARRIITEGDGFSRSTIVGNEIIDISASYQPEGAVKTDSTFVIENSNLFSTDIVQLYPPFAVFSGSTVFNGSPNPADCAQNYWGSTESHEIESEIWDFFDDPTRGPVAYEPFLTTPSTEAPVVVADIEIIPSPPLSSGTATFTVHFSRPMKLPGFPEVFFGPAEPYTSHPIDLNLQWINDTTFRAEVEIDRYTGDGIHSITVWNAEDTQGFPIPTGDHRFRFEISTTGTSSAALSAIGGIGQVDLSWFASTLPTLAGYNVYRADTSGGPYTKLNGPLVADVTYADHTAEPGLVYYFIYRVVNSEMEEGPDSDETSAAALDDIPPVITHTQVTSAPAGLPVTITAEITDNVATPTASLFHRELGSADPWDEVVMINATGDQYTANVPGAAAVAPGVEYYLEASDGVNVVQDGTPAAPHAITILDQPTVDAVTPDHGPLAGGTPVTITGTNFQSGCTVEIGGVAASSVVVVDPQTITCDTPAHYPAVVDVTVTNPNMAAGTKTRAYTYNGSPTIIELPTTAHDRLSTTTLGISTPGVEGLISATLEFSYDPAVLSVQSAGAGSLTGGWTLSANTATPGTVRISLAGTTPVTGLGTIAEVTVDVIGAPAAVTALTWVQAELNEGVIPETAVNGELTVNNAFDVSGNASYYIDARPVEGATMTLDGSASYSQATAADGSFAIDNVPSDNYTLTPTKSDDVGIDDISALDASFVLQHDAGLMTLDPQQQTAGDVNGSGSPTALDASYILQYSVGLIFLPFPGAGAVWAFDPQNLSYTPLNTNQPGQDFAGILIGDPTGNWNSGGGESLDGIGAVALPHVEGCGETTPISLDLVDLGPGTDVYSMDLTIHFDPQVILLTDVALGAMASGWSIVVNDQTPGVVRIAMAGANPIVTTGELLVMTVEPIAEGSSSLLIERAQLNEGRITTNTVHGRVINCALFADGFEDGTTGSWTTD